jgi:uncharacterized protein YndB with AHSA1/START domain
MDINRRAPVIAEGTIQIDAPPEIVWGVLTDIAGWPSWNPGVKTAQLRGSLAEGSVFRWKSGGVPITSVIRGVDPPREIGWTGSMLGVRAIHVYRFEPRDGGTLARTDESWEGFLASTLKGYSRTILNRGIEKSLGALKREAERRRG